MAPLDRKLARDLWRMKGQVVAIALVIAAGVATVVLALGTLHSLQETRDAYYDRYQFANVFAQARRAPEHLARQVAAIPGVAQVETRIVDDIILDIPGLEEPARARILSLPDRDGARLNRVQIRIGRGIDADHPDEILVHEAFAEAHGLVPGDTITGNINGKARRLRVVGIALSPEFVYVIGPGDLVPDNRRFGLIWMGRGALEAAYDLDGAFNDISLRLTRAAVEAEVIERLDGLLDPFGGVGAYTRHDQISDAFLRSEIEQLNNMARIIPPIFLAVAAFLLNIVVTRLVETEREQIGLFKAFGYSDLAVGWLYLKLVLAIAVLGILLGWAGGAWMGRGMTALYIEYFRFPFLYYLIDPAVFAVAALASLAAAVAGALYAVRRAVRLAPAVAMAPPAPTVYRNTIVERAVPAGMMGPMTRMVWRHIARWPLRSATTIVGVAASVALLVLSLFFIDAIDEMLDAFFFRSQHQDVTVQFANVRQDAVGFEIAHLPGVLAVEQFRAVPARLRHGHLSRRTQISGIEPDAQFSRLFDPNDRPIALPPFGIVLTAKLAERLDAVAGDVLTVEVLEGRRPVRRLPVSLIVHEYVGTAAYMDRSLLNRLMVESAAASGSHITVDPLAQADLMRALKDIPVIQGVTARRAALDTFRSMIDDTMGTMVSFYLLFASLIAVGVVYNSARISLSERGRELASMRVLGFYKGEVIAVLLGEMAILTVLAMPLGCLFGYGLAALLVGLFDSDLYRLPLIVQPSTYGYAVLVIAVAAAATGVAVARRIAGLDLIAVLKTRE